MAGFKNHRDVHRAITEGRIFRSNFRKNATAGTQAQQWADLTRSPGNPGPFYYASAPMTFAPMSASTHGGIPHGRPVAPAKKHLHRLWWLPYSNESQAGMLVDVLGYVPFVPQDDPGSDMAIDFNVANKPARWGNGNGVVMYLEIAAPHAGIGGNTVEVTYTNGAGASKVTGPGYLQGSSITNGGLLLLSTGSVSSTVIPQGPFFGLAHGDDSIQSAQSIKVTGPGDIGLATLVFARIVADFPAHVGGLAGWPLVGGESVFGGKTSPMLPVVDDDAFLSILINAQRTSLTQVFGQADFIWSD